MWQPIGQEAYEETIEFAVLADGAVLRSLSPCRREVGGWCYCPTHESIEWRPTHWRPARVPCAYCDGIKEKRAQERASLSGTAPG